MFPLLRDNLIHVLLGRFEENKLLMSFYRTDSVIDFFFRILIRTKQDSNCFHALSTRPFLQLSTGKEDIALYNEFSSYFYSKMELSGTEKRKSVV